MEELFEIPAAEPGNAADEFEAEDDNRGNVLDEPATLTEEELDHVADTAIAALQDILKYFKVGEVTIDEYEGDEGELILDITGDDLAVLIGRHGKTLEALQFLVSSITVRTIGFRYPVVVDVEGNAFLHNMVRAITGTLVEVGQGRRDAAWVAHALAARDRSAAGPTAPAMGLTLERVTYPQGALVPWS